jgi:hypothetical protein
LPAGHGELVVDPPRDEWAALVAANVRAAAEWDFSVGGREYKHVREQARADAIARAAEFCDRLGIEVAEVASGPAIVATGHQPGLYHPGVWIKDFILQSLAAETGSTGLDVVVDTDGFSAVEIVSPCMSPGIARCRQYLSIGTTDGSYLGSRVPDRADIDDFVDATLGNLATLSAPAVSRHFEAFGAHLREAAREARNLAELITVARRRYEASAETDYLELPVSEFAGREPFLSFVCDIVMHRRRFAADYNTALADFRALTNTRSTAQPFPDLDTEPGTVELPFWVVIGGARSTLRVQDGSGGPELVSEALAPLALPMDPSELGARLAERGALIAPKALTLTMFVRMFLCDLFIHGIGGGRYDQVTDDVIRRYYGVEPPAFAVTSLTMYLPLGAHAVGPEEVAAAKERLNRLTHNPDALLDEVTFDDESERGRARELATEKASLVAEIASPQADKKSIGTRIRQVNEELAAILAPLRETFEDELARLETQMAAAEILTDRTYPFCFWDPREVADKAG